MEGMQAYNNYNS